MSQYRAYFVPGNVDPWGLQTIGRSEFEDDGFNLYDHGFVDGNSVKANYYFRGHSDGTLGLTVGTHFEEGKFQPPFLSRAGFHDIRSFRFGGCHCAKVFSSKDLKIDIHMIRRSWIGQSKKLRSVSASGYADIRDHELRRVSVYRAAFKKYVIPWRKKGSAVLKCGTICRSKPGQARSELMEYLDLNQIFIASLFEEHQMDFKTISKKRTWVAKQQAAISGENDHPKIVNGVLEGIEEKHIHNVGTEDNGKYESTPFLLRPVRSPRLNALPIINSAKPQPEK